MQLDVWIGLFEAVDFFPFVRCERLVFDDVVVGAGGRRSRGVCDRDVAVRTSTWEAWECVTMPCAMQKFGVW